MPSRYWIKFYIEVLDDPKMGRLSDRLWRRACELFLVAGEIHNGGSLPSLEDLAWRLRLTSEELSEDLDQLAELGILKRNDDCWHVTNFSKRQAPSTDAERQRQLRERKRKSQYHDEDDVTDESQEPVTNCDDAVTEPVTTNVTSRDVDTDTESESDTKRSGGEKIPPPPPPPPKSRKKPKKPIPPAVQVFRDAAHRFPAKSWWSKVASIVGDAEADLAFWGRVVENYVGLGWNPTNVKTMLEFYRRREIPTVGKQRKKQPGQFTDAELEKARRESLAEKPIDVATFLGEGA